MQIMISCAKCGQRPTVRPQEDGSYTALCPNKPHPGGVSVVTLCPTLNMDTLDGLPEAWNKMQLEAERALQGL